MFSVRLELTKGKHTIECTEGGFCGLLYGVGRADSYAMILGSSLSNPFANDTIDPVLDYTQHCGELSIIIKETSDASNTGFAYLLVMQDSTYNYSWNYTDITDTTTYIEFHATPSDYTQEAKIVFDYRDKNGNGGRFSFVYPGNNIQVPKNIQIKNVKDDDSVVISISITNPGTSDITLDSISKFEDNRLTLLDNDFPVIIPGNTTLNIHVAFVPKGNTASLYERVKLYFDCYRNVITNVISNVISPHLISFGYDFGIVRIADTKEGKAYIINQGNISVILSALEFAIDSPFSLDTNTVFPYNLEPLDTLFIDAEFSPQSNGYFELYVSVKNEFEIDAPFKLTGTGAAPSFSSKIIDWKRRRIGTTNDTTIFLKNEGDFSGKIVFSEYVLYNSVFSTYNIEELNKEIEYGDSTALQFSFSPVLTNDYSTEISLNVDWQPHDNLSIELLGVGTIPQIQTFDVDFDTIIVWTDKDSIAKNIFSFGNETLTIDKIVHLSGDTSSFVIDYSKLSDLKIDSGFYFDMPIDFFPKRVGKHQLILEVTNDAAPNYERKTSYINLIGFAVPADTTDMEIILTTPEDLTACLDSEINFEVKK
jgi:hypothetical protein